MNQSKISKLSLLVISSLLSFNIQASCVGVLAKLADVDDVKALKWSQDVFDYILDHADYPTNKSDLATALNMKPDEFSEIFQDKKTEQITRDILKSFPPIGLAEGKLKAKIFKLVGVFFYEHFRLPEVDEFSNLLKISEKYVDDFYDKKALEEILVSDEKYLEIARRKIMERYAKYVNDSRITPGPSQFADYLFPDLNPEHRIRDINKLFGGNLSSDTKVIVDGNEVTLWDLAKKQKFKKADFDEYLNSLMKSYTSTDQLRTELASTLNVSKATIKPETMPYQLFPDGIIDLKKLAQSTKPHVFKNAIDTDVFTEKRLLDLENAVKNAKKLLVTTAVAGIPVHDEFFQDILFFLEKNDAHMLVIPSNMQTHNLDAKLLSHPRIHIVTNAVEISEDWVIDNIKVMPKQINPTAGLDDIGPRGQSRIIGHPRKVWKTIPTISNKHRTHNIISTGAITRPIYNSLHQIQERTADLSKHRHNLGALLLERDHKGKGHLSFPTKSMWHPRYIDYVENFRVITDQNHMYSEGKVENFRPLALIPGDIHVLDMDLEAMIKFREIAKKMKPRYILVHDLFNGKPLSRHETNNKLLRAKRYRDGQMDLMHEILSVAEVLEILVRENPQTKIVIIPSNHNDWLPKWISEGRFMDDIINQELGLELASVMSNGKDPLAYALKKYGVPTEFHERLIFLEHGIEFKLGDIKNMQGKHHIYTEGGQHGHEGAHGARGSLNQFAKGADVIAYGHSHVLAYQDGAVNIMTFTPKELDYSKGGMSAWQTGFGLLNDYAKIQAFIFKDGRFFTESKDISDEAIFSEGFPYIVPNSENPDTPAIGDQYRVK